MTDRIAERLAEYVAHTNYKDLPATSVAAAKRLMLDTLGVAWAGSNAAGCSSVYELVRAQAGRQESSVWAYGDKLPVTSTSFVNSVFAAALDYDGLHELGTLHADIVVLPAAMAVAERQQISGREFIAALVLAEDLTCRLGISTQERKGWFLTSVHGVFGAAAATAKLLRLDAEGIRNALGLAYLNAAGTQQAAFERSLAKRMESAFAARAGVWAGLLASFKCDGPKEPFEGRFGLYNLYENGVREEVIRELGSRFENQQITIKRYPSCGCTHAAIDAALALSLKHDLLPQKIRSIQVSISPYMNRLVGAPFMPGENPQVSAQFSVHYAIACAIRYRRFGLSEIQDTVILDQKNRQLAEMVRVVVDEENTGVMAPATVRIETTDGETYEQTITHVRGGPEDPFDDADVVTKFSECVRFGARPLDGAQIQRIVKRVFALEELDNMAMFWEGTAR